MTKAPPQGAYRLISGASPVDEPGGLWAPPQGTYRLISGDSHVNEPGDLWTTRVPSEFRDRAPRIDHFDQGDAWVLEGVRDPINFGMNACAGLAPADMHAWSRFADMRAG